MNNFINIYSIHSIFYNDSSTIVALSKTNGIYVYRKNFLTPITVEKKENAAFYAQLLMPDNNTILTSDRNLFTKKGHVGKLSNFPVCISQSMLRTKQNEYWYFTYDKEPGKIDLYKSKYPGKEAMLVDVFKENPSLLFEDSKKNIWRITYQSIGFYSESNNFNKIAQGIGNMTSIVEDNRHIIWFGTEKGLYFYNPKNKKYTCLSFFGFKDINIRFILPDSTTNSLWLGTYSNGFYRIEFSNQKITKLPNDKNNILNTVHSIIEDSYHRFWITTNNGLFVATKKSLLLYCADSTQIPYYFYFDKSSGFLTNEFNGGCQPGYIRLPDGNISMPSINGLVWFNPDKIIIPFSKTPIFIDKIIINGEKYLTDSNIIETKSSNCNIEFEVSTITWSNQNNNYIEYAFSKKDETKQGVWIKLNTDYRIIFPFLNSGKYILHLRKRRSFEPDDYIYKSVIIDVPKSWYQIWYFYTAFVALATLLIYFIFSARNRYILRKNILLEKQITIATENLKEEKENLEQSNLVKSKLISTFNHDISTPLFYINSVLRSLAANKDVPDSIREPLHLVSNTSTELQLLTSDMLAWVEYQKDKSNFVLQHEWINIRKLIEEKWKIFEENAKKKSIHLSIDFDEAARIYTDSRIFSIIVYNLLSNSAKYLKSGSVKVSFLNGGSAKPDILSIHDESLEADGLPGNVNTEELSRGFGMGIMKDFSDLLGIRISFYKNSKKNMSVELIIPPSQEIRTDI